LIGTEKRLEYTAISDSVNTAKRIQENSAKNQILISKDAYERVKKSGSQASCRNALKVSRVR
jgi:adenylate cyclase